MRLRAGGRPHDATEARRNGAGLANSVRARLEHRAADDAHRGICSAGRRSCVRCAAPGLRPWLYAAAITGAVLTLIEAFPRVVWCYQGRGVLVWLKLFLLGWIPVLWDYRVPILFVVIVLASVGSHMPARFRYYSIVHCRVLD